jgi:hypothetical protein
MREARLRVVVAINNLIDANLIARTQLEDNERLLRESIVRVESGVAIGEILHSLPTVEERAANREAVQTFYARRAELRDVIIKAALDEGMSVSDLAAEFGIPHDVIASQAAMSTGETDPTP